MRKVHAVENKGKHHRNIDEINDIDEGIIKLDGLESNSVLSRELEGSPCPISEGIHSYVDSKQEKCWSNKCKSIHKR